MTDLSRGSIEQPTLVGFKNPVWLPSYWTSNVGSTGGQAGVSGRVFITPLWVPYNLTISHITLHIQTVGGAGTNLRIGLYADNGNTPQGGALLEDSGLIVADSGNRKDFVLTTPRKLTTGFVWLALETEDTTIVFSRCGVTSGGWFADLTGEMLNSCHYDQPLGLFAPLQGPCPTVTNNPVARFISFVRVDSIDG